MYILQITCFFFFFNNLFLIVKICISYTVICQTQQLKSTCKHYLVPSDTCKNNSLLCLDLIKYIWRRGMEESIKVSMPGGKPYISEDIKINYSSKEGIIYIEIFITKNRYSLDIINLF